ncbi:MAG: hypothetical protein NVSMB22_18930 [Chloroflexota bacterium]
MNVGNMPANDLCDYFTPKPDFTPHTSLPQAAPLAARAESMRIARLTGNLDYTTYDRDTGRLDMRHRLLRRQISRQSNQSENSRYE